MEVSKNYLKYLCCLIPFMFSSIVYTQTINSYANILLMLKLLAFLYILKEYVRNNFFSKFDAALGIYFFIWFISVLINGGSIIGYIKEAVVISSFVFIIENAFGKKEDVYLIFAFEHILFFLLTVNLICLIFYPEGLWTTYSNYGHEATYSFLGLYNQVTPILIIAELILLIRFQYDQYKVTRFSIMYAIVLIGNLYLMMSATGIIGCIIVPVIAVLGYKYRNYINIRITSIVIIAIFLLIVVFRGQNIFAFIIENIFDKDLTLSNRVGIWDRAIEMIKQKPLLGYGCGTLDTVIEDRNAHDYYLQIFIQAGLIGFAAYANIFYVALKECWLNKVLDSSIIIASALSGYLVCCISEVYIQAWLLIILSFGYHVLCIPGDSQKSIQEERF